MSKSRSLAPGSRTKDRLIDDAVRRFRLLAKERREAEAPPPPKVITIARQLGAGGRRVAEVLSEQLGWPLYDKEILELLAKRAGSQYHKEMFEALDEKSQHEVERIFSSLLGHLDQFTIMYLLPKVVVTLAQTDSIILGRAAHLHLPGSLRVRIEASNDVRIQNMIRFENLDAHDATRQIARSDRSRARFIRDMCSSLPEKARWCKEKRMYDLTINTDDFSINQAAEIVICAIKQKFPDKKPPAHQA